MLISVEKAKTGLKFFKENGCGGFLSGRLPVHEFAQGVECLAYNTDFYTILKANLTPKELRRVLEELAHIRRPMKGAEAKVTPWRLPERDFAGMPQLESKFHNEVGKLKNIHAEMMLMTYLLGSGGPSVGVFPYFGVSKRTSLLCGHMLRLMGQFETRGNHGKCYSLWTLPSTLWANLETKTRLRLAVQCMRDVLRDEASKIEVSHRDAEKESVMRAPVPPRYEKKMTLFNSVVEEPRFREGGRVACHVSQARQRSRMTPRNDRSLVNADVTRDDASVPIINTESPESKEVEGASPTACAFCKDTYEVIYICKKCESAAYCNLDCYRSDWYRHKFCCTLGRPIDATDFLVLSCHTNEFPQEDDVTKQYGFMSFASGNSRSRLFRLYRRLVIEWGVDEDELRSAVELNRLKEMLTFRCSQTRDPGMLSDMRWLESEEGFGANGKGPGLIVLFDKAREELLRPDERKVPIVKLQPPEKRKALVFYVQIRNGFKPDVSEDNWISLGFCTVPDSASEQRLAGAYGSLVEQCSFDEFWTSMAESRIVELFSRYGLADQISHMRNFKDFVSIVQKRHQSVWELKRFVLMNEAHPFRAVVVDYGFMHCEDPRQRMHLRAIYQEYFDRGKDEMRLHEACVAGKLVAFLESVFGSLAVAPELLLNPYPLEDHPMMCMVTDRVIMCPQSALDQVRALEGVDETEMVIPVPDAEDEAIVSRLHDSAAFLGTGLRRRDYTGSGGTLIRALSCS
ncbi:hypothetical protein ACRE_049300 [Hapsidospora chrysogenum ATCC 11550]|uniref:MYND-type domain-containing protein n=1 Tax=Hapsidospora chrysogenum (strain ATCC 11550 / CBS 779.69 / DSM 880 / IAM 14645 / JCM 23072 / IMI 49137) TaxID=857340 RepID=A0A086T4L1_HAPC1|nr:hypothetical protein ACRE_049300 [Hapsidospora chrysogenum ATCC 11550]